MTEFAIPSHARADMARKYTLAMLDRYKIHRDNIHVFVSEDQLESYRRALPEYDIMLGAPRLVGNRNFIATAFPEGTQVVSVDDDVKKLVHVPVGEHKAREIDDLEFKGLLYGAFNVQLDKFRAALWGLNRTSQGLFLSGSPQLHVGLPTLEGNFYGFVSGRTDLEVPDVSDSGFEDLERPLKVYDAGWNLVRYSRVGYVQYTGTAGGRARARNACDDACRIIQAYPQYTAHGTGKLKTQSKCKPVIRRGMMVRDPETLYEVDLLREKARTASPPEIPDPPHGEEIFDA